MKFEKYTTESGKTKWKLYHYLGLNEDNGKPIEVRRRGFNTQAEARTKLTKIIREFEENQQLEKLTKDRYRFEEVVDLQLIQYKNQVKITTFMNTTSLLKNHILPEFGDYFIDRIDVRMCQNAVNRWYATYSDASLLVSIASRVFKFSINQGFYNNNPMDKIIRPKNTYKKDYQSPFYDKEEVLRFLKILKNEESLKAYTMFHTLTFTGLRRGELLALQWKDIDFSRRVLSVNHNLIYNEELKEFQLAEPKTKNSKREIGIDDATIRVLLTWHNYQREFFLGRGINAGLDEQLVFTSQTNHYMTDAYLRRIIKRVTKKHNLPHITVHGFRHTHCSLLFEAGIEMQNVKERLGHSNIKTTMNIYAHVTKAERTKTADIFSEFMANNMF